MGLELEAAFKQLSEPFKEKFPGADVFINLYKMTHFNNLLDLLLKILEVGSLEKRYSLYIQKSLRILKTEGGKIVIDFCNTKHEYVYRKIGECFKGVEYHNDGFEFYNYEETVLRKYFKAKEIH